MRNKTVVTLFGIHGWSFQQSHNRWSYDISSCKFYPFLAADNQTEKNPFSFITALQKPCKCKLSSVNFPYTRKPLVFNNCYSTFLVPWNSFCNLLNGLGHLTGFINMCKYMYIKYMLLLSKLT